MWKRQTWTWVTATGVESSWYYVLEEMFNAWMWIASFFLVEGVWERIRCWIMPRWAAASKKWGRRDHDWFGILYIWLWICLFCPWAQHISPLHLSGFPALAISNTNCQITIISRWPCLNPANFLGTNIDVASQSTNAHSLVLTSWLWLASPICSTKL